MAKRRRKREPKRPPVILQEMPDGSWVECPSEIVLREPGPGERFPRPSREGGELDELLEDLRKRLSPDPLRHPLLSLTVGVGLGLAEALALAWKKGREPCPNEPRRRGDSR